MQNLSRSKRFGKFVLIVGDNCPFKKDSYRGIPMVHLAPLVSPSFPLVSPWFTPWVSPWCPPGSPCSPGFPDFPGSPNSPGSPGPGDPAALLAPPHHFDWKGTPRNCILLQYTATIWFTVAAPNSKLLHTFQNIIDSRFHFSISKTYLGHCQ